MNLVEAILPLMYLNRAVKEFKHLCIDDISSHRSIECDAMHMLIKLHLSAVLEVVRW